ALPVTSSSTRRSAALSTWRWAKRFRRSAGKTAQLSTGIWSVICVRARPTPTANWSTRMGDSSCESHYDVLLQLKPGISVQHSDHRHHSLTSLPGPEPISLTTCAHGDTAPACRRGRAGTRWAYNTEKRFSARPNPSSDWVGEARRDGHHLRLSPRCFDSGGAAELAPAGGMARVLEHATPGCVGAGALCSRPVP